VFCLIALQLNAQDTIAHKETDLHCTFCTNTQNDFLHGDPYIINFKNELPYIYATTGLVSVGLIFLKTNKADPFTIQELNTLDRSTINSFDRGATYNNSQNARSVSDILFKASVALPSLVFLVNKHTRQDILSLFTMGAEAFAISAGFNLNAKHIFNRSRPYVFNPAFSNKTRTNSSSRLSFFSGHTSQAATASFFLAKVISDYHPNLKPGIKIGLWTTAFALPAVTGYLRVESGRHYYTDVIAGFTIGALVGYLVPHLHNKDNEKRFKVKPFGPEGAVGLGLSYILE
jgi:membrane-associated phospholipid phosphatase